MHPTGFTRLELVAMLAALLLCACLMGCARREWPQLDTLRVPSAAVHKIKARTVIVQAGTGNVASTTDKVRAQSAAIGPGAQASATTHKGPPVWVYLLLVAVGAGAWEGLSHAGLLRWLPWRVFDGVT